MTDTTAYHRPATLEDALTCLSSGGWRIAAGCTDIFPATERKSLPGAVLDITGIAALRGIETTPDGIRIGATTTWTDLIRADLPRSFAGLKMAAREVGAMQIQNQGTLAGNLCNASPAADGVPPLLTLDAEVELHSANGQRRLPLHAFITGPRKTALQPDELLSAIVIPQTALSGDAHFLKLGARHYLVISIAMTAARIELQGGIVSQAALSVGSCGPVSVRLTEIENRMIGHPADPKIITDALVAAAINPIDDMRADAAYRACAAAELMRRTVRALLNADMGIAA